MMSPPLKHFPFSGLAALSLLSAVIIYQRFEYEAITTARPRHFYSSCR